MKTQVMKNWSIAAVAIALLIGTASLAYADGEGDAGADPGASSDANAGNNNDQQTNNSTAQQADNLSAITGAPQQVQQVGCIQSAIDKINSCLMQHPGLMQSGASNVGSNPAGMLVGFVLN